MDWGKMYKANGKMNKGMKHYESKHPSSHKSSKWEKKKGKKEKKPKKSESEPEYNEDDSYDEGGAEGGAEGAEEGAYDVGGHELAAQHDGELMDGHVGLAPQPDIYGDLAGHGGYVLDDAAAGQLAGALADWYKK